LGAVPRCPASRRNHPATPPASSAPMDARNSRMAGTSARRAAPALTGPRPCQGRSTWQVNLLQFSARSPCAYTHFAGKPGRPHNHAESSCKATISSLLPHLQMYMLCLKACLRQLQPFRARGRPICRHLHSSIDRCVVRIHTWVIPEYASMIPPRRRLLYSA
jgi:hypothetical protein